MLMSFLRTGALVALMASGSAHAFDRPSFVARASLSSLTGASGMHAPETPLTNVFQDSDALDSSEVTFSDAPPRFGTRDTWRWTIQAGGGIDIQSSDNSIMLAGVGVSYFLIENLSLNVELSGAYADQLGSDAGGVDFNLLLRWHVFDFETWTIYADGGAGMIFTFNDVPADGSSANFTPQLGVGFSFEVTREVQLLTGVRWHHISNANVYRTNPGRDSIFGYVGISVAF